MRRADRLFQIVQYLRGGRLLTADDLAQRLEVSRRTIYRDIADLMSTGVPIDGEAGVGYVMRSGYDVPPLMFTNDEIAALVTGARMLRAWGGLDMAIAAEEALIKIQSVLPEHLKTQLGQVQVYSLANPSISDDLRARLDFIETSIRNSFKLALKYSREDGTVSQRTLRPLCQLFWGQVWTLLGWCELRNDYRSFRIDRIIEIEQGPKFKSDKSISFAAFLERENNAHPNIKAHFKSI
jgi:predicted DNA-binding transcriptional regulator YafY